jgi:hypothetical protein
MDTNHPVIVYISAASDLMAEREALAHMIATLPVTLPWRVVQSPIGEELLDVATLSAADFHILVMGGDIRAPVGSEWHTIRRYNRPSVAFLKKDVTQTPAGQVFVRQAEAVWHPFIDATDLSRQARQMLVEHLVRNAVRYALTLPEVEQLAALQQADTASEQPVEGQDAGRSAVILSRERYTPSEGIIIDE